MEPQTEEKLAAFESAVEAYLSPITDSSPCGDDISYHPDFEELKNEIDKLGEGEAVDFGHIESIAGRLLKEKAKDVRVAVYMAIGQARTRKAEGIAHGLGVLRRLSEEYWDEMHPRKARRRVPMLTFLATSLSTWLERDENRRSLSDREMLERAVEETTKLGELLGEKLGDEAPPLSRLERALTSAVPKEAPKPKAAETKPDARPAEAAGDRETAGAEAQVGEIDDAASATVAIFQIAAFFRKNEPANPISFKLVRAAKWRAIVQAPASVDGVSRVPAPSPQRIEALRNLSAKGEWAILIQEAEKALQEPGFHFWLELQQLAERALRSSGADFEDAADAVVSETLLLLKRVPGLPELSFGDGTPFASYEVREWLDGFAGESGSEKRISDSGDDGLAKTLKEAESFAGSGKLNEALGVLSAASRASAGIRRFRLDLESARYLRRAGKTTLAKGVLLDLDKRVKRHDLVQWDSTIAIEVWTELLAVYNKLATEKGAGADSARQSASELVTRIAAVDVGAALKLN